MSAPFKPRPPLARETAAVTRDRAKVRKAEIATQNRKHGDDLLTGNYAIEMWPISRLHPPALNDGAFDLEHIGGIEDSIEVFGFTGVLLIDPDGGIIAGVNTYHAAVRREITELPCLVIRHLPNAKLKALRLRLNREAADRPINIKALGEILIELKVADIDLSITGFTGIELDHAMTISTGQSSAPEPEGIEMPQPGPAVTELGDLFALGGHRLLCGDALQEASYATLLAGQLARAVITDPPFDRKPASIGGRGKIKHGAFVQGSGELGAEGFRNFCGTLFSCLKGSVSAGALLYAYIDSEHMLPMMLGGEDAGLRLLDLLGWDKGRGGFGGFYRRAFEPILFYAFDEVKPVFNVALGKFGRDRTTLLRFPGATTRGSSAQKMLHLHPTPKSVECTIELCLDCSNAGDIILDPFVGTGTLIIAAERSRRVAMGIDLSPTYCDVAVRRWEAETGRSAILIATGETFAALATRRMAERALSMPTEGAPPADDDEGDAPSSEEGRAS